MLKNCPNDGGKCTVTSNSIYVEYTDSDIPPVEASREKFPNVTSGADLLKTEYSLCSYPNPFNPATQISYSLKEDGYVSLQVYNTLGEKVADLVNQFKPVGNYSVSFNASSLPSGIYICTIKSGQYTATRKLLLLK